jgi:hypothetical protein
VKRDAARGVIPAAGVDQRQPRDAARLLAVVAVVALREVVGQPVGDLEVIDRQAVALPRL